jgi:hypothetical protein
MRIRNFEDTQNFDMIGNMSVESARKVEVC